MSRPNNDHITKRGRRFTKRQQRREAFQQAAEEIRQDRSFPRSLRRVAEEALQFRSQQFSDEGNNRTSLREAESILQTLAGGDGDVEPFTTLELDSDSEESVTLQKQSRHSERSGGRRVERLINAGTDRRSNLGIRRLAIAKQVRAHTDTTRGGSERSHTDTTKRAERGRYPAGTTGPGRHHVVPIPEILG